MIKRKLLKLAWLILFSEFLAQIAWAQTTAPLSSQFYANVVGRAGYQTGDFASTPSIIIGRLILYALTFVGVIFLILTVYAGFTWMTAGGNEEKIKKAKKIITNSIIGLIIVIASYIITNYVVGSLAPSVGVNPT